MKKPPKFFTFVWNFQQAYVRRQISFINEDFPGLQKLLHDMYLSSHILGYRVVANSQKIELFLKYDSKGEPLYFLSKVVSKPSKDVLINLKQLKIETRNFPFSLGIVRTASGGLVTSYSAINSKSGGIYVGKIK